MTRPHIWIVSAASAGANNGNWRSASRWARFLRTRYRVTLAMHWPQADDVADIMTNSAQSHKAQPDLLIALHARRSAPSLLAWSNSFPERPSVLVMTGTDLYRDIQKDIGAQRALLHAGALVLMQEDGLRMLPEAMRVKASVIFPSAPVLRPMPAGERKQLDICMIGHLRTEKDPLTFMRAAALVRSPRARLIHIGGALEPALAKSAQAIVHTEARYHWLGAMPHAATRQRLKASHAMALTSQMEGGANVIVEAVNAGVPVLASDIGGNRGLLGDDYAGYFPPGDAAALAHLIDRVIEDSGFHALLRAQCDDRAPLFAPAAEQAALLELVDNLLHKTSPGNTT